MSVNDEFAKSPPKESDTLIRSSPKLKKTSMIVCIWILLAIVMFVEVSMTVPSLIIAIKVPLVCAGSTIPFQTWLIVNSATWMVISCLAIAPLAALTHGVSANSSVFFGLNMSVLVFTILFNFAWGAFGISLAVVCPLPEIVAYVVLDIVLCPLIITWILIHMCCWTECCFVNE